MASASTTTVNGIQAIKTLNNLNMEGKFKESSLKQFSNENTALITYTSDLGNAAANSTVKLYDAISETVVTFTLSTAILDTQTFFLHGNTSTDTANNLTTVINDHPAFTTAAINTSTNTITVTQNTSKSYEPNDKTGFTDTSGASVLEVTDFNVNSGDEAAIPSETIGTYQILNKVITDLSTLKKKIITRNKTLQEDVSKDTDDKDDVTLTSNLFSTHQSDLLADQNRGYLDKTASATNQKPSVFESDAIKYSEDALFRLLKGLGYEIFKFNNGHNGANNGATSGDAGRVAIPISIQAHNNNTQTATLSNVTATIHNINRSDGTIDTSANTSAGSIPEGDNNSAAGVGLIQLINSIINNITLIKRSIKTRELAILTALKSDITNLVTDSIINMDIANRDSTIAILKVRGGLLDDDNGNNDLRKPSIFSSGNNLHYSEDAVFSLFSCISYELMKLLKGHSGNNNGGGGVLGAGLETIPASIESILL